MSAGVCSGDGADANCGWATCEPDTDFVMDMIAQLQEELCVGEIWLAGGSNGGMMTHGLYGQ
jgi:poly(3-hydroxybutyrate) depolymerase